MSRLPRGSNLSQNESQSTTSSSSRSTSMSHVTNVSQQPSISLIDCFEYRINGNINKNAMVLADCDEDKKNELLVGTVGGELLIFKDNITTPYAQSKELGMISSIIVGDILSKNRTFITTLSVEGMLNVFIFLNENSDDDSGTFNQEMMRRNSNFSISSSSNNPNAPTKLQPVLDHEILACSNKLIRVHSQQIQANCMTAALADIDNDGFNELIVALTDRVLRSYRIVQYGDEIKLVGINKWEFSDQIGMIALQKIPQSFTETEDERNDNEVDDEEKKVFSKHNVLVSQYGGVYAKLSCFESYRDVSGTEFNEQADIITQNLTPQYRTTAQNLVRNPQISAEIICDINNGQEQKLIALATSDGLLVLMDEKSILWNVQLENKVLSLKAQDVEDDGKDELIICTWNGRTFIVNLDGRILACHFEQPVSAFEVGHYHINGRKHTAFVYATFTNSIFLYYNIDFDLDRRFKSGSLIDYLKTNRQDLIDHANELIERINLKRDSQLLKVKFDSKFISSMLYNVSLDSSDTLIQGQSSDSITPTDERAELNCLISHFNEIKIDEQNR